MLNGKTETFQHLVHFGTNLCQNRCIQDLLPLKGLQMLAKQQGLDRTEAKHQLYEKFIFFVDEQTLILVGVGFCFKNTGATRLKRIL